MMSDEEQEIQDPCAEHVREAAEWQEKYKRALADYINLERRMATDVQNGINQAVDTLVRRFLTIHDDFARARDAYGVAGSDTTGLDSIIHNTDALFSEMGLVPIESEGKSFDPTLHEAMLTSTSTELDANTVIRELRKGYILNGRVVRPALVEISTQTGEE